MLVLKLTVPLRPHGLLAQTQPHHDLCKNNMDQVQSVGIYGGSVYQADPWQLLLWAVQKNTTAL